MKKAQNHIGLVLLLAFLASVAPLATDVYLPSILDISKYFDVEINKIELTLAIFLFFFAFGQLLGGILSDRIGRRKTTIIGLSGFCITSLMIFFTTSLELLYFIRAIEAIFGAIAAVNGAAVVRDLFHGKEAAKIFSAVAGIMMIAPMIAPAIGSFITSFFSWQYIFLFLSIYSFVVLIFIYFKLPDVGSKTTTKVKEAYKKVLSHKKAMGYILAVAFGFSGMFIFISKSSFIYMEYFKISKDVFPLFFGANVLTMMIFTKINMNLIQKYKIQDILKYGISLQVIASFALIFFSTQEIVNLYTIFIGMILYVSSLGFIFGNAMSLALDYFKNDSGVANSVIGVTEFTIAGVVGFLASTISSSSGLTPIFLMMSVTALISFFSLRLSR